MWESFNKEDGSLGLATFSINEVRVVIIQPKERYGETMDSFRVINYLEGGVVDSYFYEEDFELAKLMGLIKAKDLGWSIKSLT